MDNVVYLNTDAHTGYHYDTDFQAQDIKDDCVDVKVNVNVHVHMDEYEDKDMDDIVAVTDVDLPAMTFGYSHSDANNDIDCYHDTVADEDILGALTNDHYA